MLDRAIVGDEISERLNSLSKIASAEGDQRPVAAVHRFRKCVRVPTNNAIYAEQ